MKLYLMQHGEAVSKEVDPDRPLTEQGKSDVDLIARLFKSSGTSVEKILHSGKLRAAQTAERMKDQLSPTLEVSVVDNLSPNDDIRLMNWQIESEGKDTLVVGHLPFMAKLVSLLLTGNEDLTIPAYQPGSVACLEFSNGSSWQLAWMIRPDMLR